MLKTGKQSYLGVTLDVCDGRALSIAFLGSVGSHSKCGVDSAYLDV